MKKNLILFICFTTLVVSKSVMFSQSNDSITKKHKNSSIIIGSNFIYNYFKKKVLYETFYPTGKIPNSNQYVYYWNYKYFDTYTFDISAQYNQYIKKKISYSVGLRFDKLKQEKRSFLYIDSNAVLPNISRITDNYYSLSAPAILNFYYKRIKLSCGLIYYLYARLNNVYSYEDNEQVSYKGNYFGYDLKFSESFSYKILKNKNMYVKLGGIHNFDFYKNYRYGNYFTLGLNYEINLKNKY